MLLLFVFEKVAFKKIPRTIFQNSHETFFRQGWSMDKNWPVTYLWSLCMVLVDSHLLKLVAFVHLAHRQNNRIDR